MAGSSIPMAASQHAKIFIGFAMFMIATSCFFRAMALPCYLKQFRLG
jgi:hypothetical protein